MRLEIDGDDLLAAGVPEGPALGRALEETLRRKLDGLVSGRDEELAPRCSWRRAGMSEVGKSSCPARRAFFSTRNGGVSGARTARSTSASSPTTSPSA